MRHSKVAHKKIRRLAASSRLRGCDHIHPDGSASVWMVFWLLILGMLQ